MNLSPPTNCYDVRYLAIHFAALHNPHPRLHLLVQQTNRLLEALILCDCRICRFGCLDRSMVEQMLINHSSPGTGRSHRAHRMNGVLDETLVLVSMCSNAYRLAPVTVGQNT